MSKKKIFVILVILLTVLSLSTVIYDGFYRAPSRFRVNYQNLASSKIHPDLDGMQIAFISDLNYNNFMDKDRFDLALAKLETANPDIVIFVGNLFDKENIDNISDKVISDLTSQLEGINAKYGKFAILGENDYLSEDVESTISQIFYNSNFEVVKNQLIRITKDTNNYFQLIGIDSVLSNKDDIIKAYEQVSSEKLVLTVVSTPDTIEDLPPKTTDLVVAGHSLGGQIQIPLLGQVYNKDLAEKYYSGFYSVNNTKLFVTNGLGTTIEDVRIFAPAEILIYTLKSLTN